MVPQQTMQRRHASCCSTKPLDLVLAVHIKVEESHRWLAKDGQKQSHAVFHLGSIAGLKNHIFSKASFCSLLLLPLQCTRANQFSKTSLADLKQSYAQLREKGGEAWQHFLDAGRAGTLAHSEAPCFWLQENRDASAAASATAAEPT